MVHCWQKLDVLFSLLLLLKQRDENDDDNDCDDAAATTALRVITTAARVATAICAMTSFDLDIGEVGYDTIEHSHLFTPLILFEFNIQDVCEHSLHIEKFEWKLDDPPCQHERKEYDFQHCFTPYFARFELRNEMRATFHSVLLITDLFADIL